jgi:hypothetical protein
MIYGFFTSIAIFFFLFSVGFGLTLALSKRRFDFTQILVFSPVFGLVSILLWSSWLIPRGVTIESVNVLLVIASLILALIFRNRIPTINLRLKQNSTRLQKRKLLFEAGILLSAIVLPYIFLDSTKIMSLRLGIDGALYADGAQALLANENSPGLEKIANLHPGSLATALFFVHFRWGTSFLLASVSNFLNVENSLQIAYPLFATVLLLIGLSGYIYLRRILSKSLFSVLFLIGVSCNAFFIHLLQEAQWPNLVAILLLLVLTLFFIDSVNNNSLDVQTSILFGSLLGAIVVIYAEILPLLFGTLILFYVFKFFLNIMNRNFNKFYFLNLLLFMMSFVIFLIPNLKITFPYYRSIFFPTYENVGYPAPRGLWFSDLVGWTNSWHAPREWLWRDASVKHLAESTTIDLGIVNLIGLFFVLSFFIWLRFNLEFLYDSYRRGAKFNKSQSFNLTISIFAVVTVGLFSLAIGRFFILEYNQYLLTKSLSFLLPLLLLPLIYFLYRSSFMVRLSKLLGVFVVISSLIFPTLQTGARTYRDMEKINAPLGKTELGLSASFKNFEDCAFRFKPRGVPNSQSWWADRTKDYYMLSVFRFNPILEDQGSLPIVGQYPKLQSMKICFVYSETDSGMFNFKNSKVLSTQKEDNWILVKTNYSLDDNQWLATF